MFEPGKIVAIAIAALWLGTSAAAAASVPDTVKPPSGGNYGSTSFYDGFGRTTEGVTFQQYVTWASFNTIKGFNGHAAAVNLPGGRREVFEKPLINAEIALTQISYISGWHPFGGDGVGFSVATPLIDVTFHGGAGSLGHLRANHIAIGDTVFGPIYQSKYVKAASGRPEFAWRFQLIILAPTGGFNKHANINQGCGYWVINPYIATTWAPTSHLEFSTRFNYQYNLQTNNLADAKPIYTNGQAGQMIYDNFDASYKLRRKLEIGFNGFFIDSLTPDKTGGINVPHSYESEVFIGPGMRVTFSPGTFVNVNLYLPVEAANESVGPKFNLQFVHRF